LAKIKAMLLSNFVFPFDWPNSVGDDNCKFLLDEEQLNVYLIGELVSNQSINPENIFVAIYQ
jgi:hypothetical protein